MAICTDTVWVNTQSVGIHLHPTDGTTHIFNAGWRFRFLNQAVVHICYDIAFHGIVNHEGAIDHVVLGACTPAATVDDEDGGTVLLGTEEGLCEVEHSAGAHIGAVGDVFGHGDFFLLVLCRQREDGCEQRGCHQHYSHTSRYHVI